MDDDHHCRSPKSLVELCIDTVCRTLPDLDGELPPGLPQDVVDDLIRSLMQHSAVNATTLRALRNCEFGILSLASCRGVTDEWLEPLSHSSCHQAASCNTTGSTPPLSPSLYPSASSPMNQRHECSMDIDEVGNSNTTSPHRESETMPPFQLDDMDHHDHHHHALTTAELGNMEDASSSCSTSSFLSASSTPSTGELTPSQQIARNFSSLKSPMRMERDNSLALLPPAEHETTSAG